MGKGAQQVAKRDEQLSADDAWIEKMDLAGFRDEIRALGKELEAGQGPADAGRDELRVQLESLGAIQWQFSGNSVAIQWQFSGNLVAI